MNVLVFRPVSTVRGKGGECVSLLAVALHQYTGQRWPFDVTFETPRWGKSSKAVSGLDCCEICGLCHTGLEDSFLMPCGPASSASCAHRRRCLP